MSANTPVQPDAVVVKSLYAYVAVGTVLRSGWLVSFTSRANGFIHVDNIVESEILGLTVLCNNSRIGGESLVVKE